MLKGYTSLREQMHQGLTGLREEMQHGDANLREDMLKGYTSLREQMHSGDQSLRHQMQHLETSMDLKLAALDHTLTRSTAATRIWMLLQSAAMLGVMARGFGWL
jgi:hypothetical protein